MAWASSLTVFDLRFIYYSMTDDWFWMINSSNFDVSYKAVTDAKHDEKTIISIILKYAYRNGLGLYVTLFSLQDPSGHFKLLDNYLYRHRIINNANSEFAMTPPVYIYTYIWFINTEIVVLLSPSPNSLPSKFLIPTLTFDIKPTIWIFFKFEYKS